ncbi:hypothetical protein NITHO_3540005 [Nitrolancea hollandica Lb]|uniref:Uncharacterized protein n=1 Tax=Nitrolancea hollandica Lb TaxID=1129897 RepID=I4EIL8_9BACT|nr:hypothetical protein NITHO_3540005 [Nitrolancea hollandica Lb]
MPSLPQVMPLTGAAVDPVQLALIGMALLGVALLLSGIGMRRRNAITTLNHERGNGEDNARWWPN